MAKKAKSAVKESSETIPDQNIPISVEQICAAIVNLVGPVEVQLSDLMADYSGKSIAVNQDEETKALTFSLVDSPKIDDSQKAETE